MSVSFYECYRHCIIWYSSTFPEFPYCVANNWTNTTSCFSSVQYARNRIDHWIDDQGLSFFQCGDAKQEVHVVKEHDNSPVENVSVSANPDFSGGHSWSCLTDSDGKCVFTHLYPSKSYTFSISPPSPYSCDPCSKSVFVPASAISFYLLAPSFSISRIPLAPLPSLSLQLESTLKILPTVSLQSPPSLSLSELKNILFTLSRLLPPPPSLSVSLQLIGRSLPKFTFEDLPELLASLELLPFPHDVLTDTIVAENARAVAEAAFEHARRFNITGYTQPPFFCFICGETFNNHDDFISHLISHVQAYEENNYE